MNKISILLADDQTLVREGIRTILSLEPDLKVVGEAEDGLHVLRLSKDLFPEVVLLDFAMPGLNGLEVTRQLLNILPSTKVIILTAHRNDACEKSAAAAGATGCLSKENTASDVCRAIRDVHNGKAFFSPSITRRFGGIAPRTCGDSRERPNTFLLLSSREMEVLQLIAEGNANKLTAAKLSISIKTVEKHRGHLMEKLNIHSTAGLTRYAIASGMIESMVADVME